MFFGLLEACSYEDDMRAIGLTEGLAGKRIVVQGLGNVGFHTAKFCREQGAILIALAEREGAIFNPNGLNEEEVVEHRRRTGSILGFPGARDLPASGDALELECDVLVPAALENVLTANNAPRIKAKIVLEGANARFSELGENGYLAIKEPNGSIGAPLLAEAFPESLMILLVRDPRDVVSSAMAAQRKGSWGEGWRANGGGDSLADMLAER